VADKVHIVLIFSILIALVYFSVRANRSNTNKNTDLTKEQQALIKFCDGDIKKAKRLVKLEINKNPNITFDSAVENAIHFLKRDS